VELKKRIETHTQGTDEDLRAMEEQLTHHLRHTELMIAQLAELRAKLRHDIAKSHQSEPHTKLERVDNANT
jgi:hypothetical protein